MIEGLDPLAQAALGTLFTWGMTAAGAALVIFFRGAQRKLLDAALGFAAGVMTAASFWSLLAPAIEIAQVSGLYGSDGQWTFVPVVVGFLIGAFFVFSTDLLLAKFGTPILKPADFCDEASGPVTSGLDNNPSEASIVDVAQDQVDQATLAASGNKRWKRIVLLIIAITVHNIPEGLAVGMSFGAVGQSPSATFENARNLAIGIGLQNFPEGLAVSLPLHGAGVSIARSLWYGQLSGMVEPLAGILGAATVQVASPLLPYALSFAAGAMIYVVLDDIVPEANSGNSGRLATWGGIVGFTLMMALDVGLG
ncbi:zinc transporter ZIP11-like [Neocloeon triangulifer]|uniref:zinc transporter ZIP11-like n=1 Tax=Neocloeon triangulifer TaxID=2078957 RepID=UPI00286EF603|nr:zinc transporter ZIP11-like [Neocloeon triangulifer]